MNHAPGARSLGRPINHQPNALPLWYWCPRLLCEVLGIFMVYSYKLKYKSCTVFLEGSISTVYLCKVPHANPDKMDGRPLLQSWRFSGRLLTHTLIISINQAEFSVVGQMLWRLLLRIIAIAVFLSCRIVYLSVEWLRRLMSWSISWINCLIMMSLCFFLWTSHAANPLIISTFSSSLGIMD